MKETEKFEKEKNTALQSLLEGNEEKPDWTTDLDLDNRQPGELANKLMEQEMQEGDTPDLKEAQELETILRRESSCGSQCAIHTQILVLTLIAFSVNLIRGSPKTDSIIGIDTCSPISFSLLGLIAVLCLLVTWYNVRVVQYEQSLKLKYSAGLTNSCLILKDNMTWYVLAMSFVGSFFGNAFGLGGGFIYNPVQMGLGVSPPVAASTSMYMITYSAAASASLFLIFGKVNIPFSLWMAIYCGVGVMFGMHFMGKAIKKYRRPSLVSIALAVTLVISTAFSAYMNVDMLIKQKKNGLDITTGDDIC